MKRNIILSLITILVVDSFMIGRVSAVPLLSDIQIKNIASSCKLAQTSIARVEESDKVARVNLGQRYDALGGRLMQSMNNRLLANSVNVTSLVKINQDFLSEREYFRSDYTRYEEFMRSTISINCQDHPVEFYSSLDNARVLRKKLYEHTQNLQNYAQQYLNTLDSLGITK